MKKRKRKNNNNTVLRNFPKSSILILKEETSVSERLLSGAYLPRVPGTQPVPDLQMLPCSAREQPDGCCHLPPCANISQPSQANSPPRVRRSLRAAPAWCSLETSSGLWTWVQVLIWAPRQQGHLSWLLLFLCKQGWGPSGLSAARPLLSLLSM